MYNEMSPFYPIFFFLGIAFCIVIVHNLYYSKSKAYRQDLSNMYVVGKIKQIAKAEGLDLNKEFAEFAKITKNKKIDYEALDTTVERELQEKIAKDNNKVTEDKDEKKVLEDKE